MKPQQSENIKLVRLPGRTIWHLRCRFLSGDWSVSSTCGTYLDHFGSMTWNQEEDGPFMGNVCEKCAKQSLAWRQQREADSA